MPDRQKPLSILLVNQSWLASELRQLGHRVVTSGWVNASFDVCFERNIDIKELYAMLPKGFVPDRLVYYDDSHFMSISGLEKLEIPSVFYSVDTHHHHCWHRYFAAIFDGVLVAQKDHLTNMSVLSPNAKWFPLWAPSGLEPAAQKTIDVSFRGNLDAELHPERARFFEQLRKQVDIDVKKGPYREAYPVSRIVVNQAVRGDLNFRVFEAMAAGALLVTPKVGNGLLELFSDRADLVTYERLDAEDAAEKIRYYLEHEDERKAIAESGNRKVCVKHTSSARAKELSVHLQELSVGKRDAKNYALAVSYSSELSVLAKRKDSHSEEERERASRLAVLSIRGFSQSVLASEPVDNEIDNNIIVFKYRLERLGFEELQIEFGKTMCRLYPQSVILALSHLEDMRKYCPELVSDLHLAALDGIAEEQLEELIRHMDGVGERFRSALE